MGLDTVELILEAEKQYGVVIPDERAEATETVGQLARLLCELREQSGAPLAYDQVLMEVQGMISEQFAIPLDRVLPDARIVKDLGLD